MPRCPTCKRAVAVPAQDEPAGFFPFCGQRCKLADLHGWLTERYVVSDAAPFDEGLGLPLSSEDE